MHFNTLVALPHQYDLPFQAEFFYGLGFLMLIGFSINGLISFSTYLIWREQEPNRIAFALICIGAAPVGFTTLEAPIGLYLYNFNIPAFANMMQSGNRSAVIVSVFLSLFAGIFFWNQSKLAELRIEHEREKPAPLPSKNKRCKRNSSFCVSAD